MGRKENTIKQVSETKILMDEREHMGSTEIRKFNANPVVPPPPPPKTFPLRPYLYFERGDSIYKMLYFPILSSGGNPRASPEETNARLPPPCLSSCSQGEDASHTLFLRRLQSLTVYSMCVCGCVWGLCVCSARALDLHGPLMCWRVKDACVQCMLLCVLKAVTVHAKTSLWVQIHVTVSVSVPLSALPQTFFWHWMQIELSNVSIISDVKEISNQLFMSCTLHNIVSGITPFFNVSVSVYNKPSR